jgi:hypothetical protein
LRLGTDVSSADVADKLKDIDGPEDVQATWQRTAEHLAKNKVESYQVKVGPRLIVDPISESFPGNAPANAMLTREYRKGYEIPNESAV